MYRRPPRGGRGLKSFHIYPLVSRFSRPPRGGRGLKSHIRRHISVIHAMSPPSRGAWIEIGYTTVAYSLPRPGRPPRGGRGLK